MPRPGHAPPPSTFRNRNRFTNKTRLKLVLGDVDFESIIPDEEEEARRLANRAAGVDLEDANEHHLQAVLSQSALEAGRSTRSSEKNAPPAAFIPIPDHTGTVSDHEALYPPNRWHDPVSYVQSSSVIEEYTLGALADGCTYFMDERDKEWLDRNNEGARGEGTSAQGSVSASGSRASARSAKAKGKEPEDAQAMVMSEDEFELVMGLFEKITQEKTQFLHHSLEHGSMPFPEFSRYQAVLSAPLPPATFAAFSPPPWLPEPSHLVCLARLVYPYWKERCVERAGRRIIPSINFDELDTLNESYVCFRRRETKAIRKTRASQVTSSDKLARLQNEFRHPIQLAQHLLTREETKRDAARQSQRVWAARMKLAEMKAQHPDLGEKLDQELLVDKERPSKKAETHRVRLSAKQETPAPSTPARDLMRPKERHALYHTKVETMLQKQRDLDQLWEDHVDTGYIAPMAQHSSRLFKFINPPESSNAKRSHDSPPQKRPIRLRRGRGGRILVDRRPQVQDERPLSRRRIIGSDDEDDSMDVDEADEDADRRLTERWRYDADDGPVYGPAGSDEQDRVLVDEFDLPYMNHAALLSEPDLSLLLNDPTITRVLPDGKKELVMPYRLGTIPTTGGKAISALGRRVSVGAQQPQQQPQAQASDLQASTPTVPSSAGAPVPVAVSVLQQQAKPPSAPSIANNQRSPADGTSGQVGANVASTSAGNAPQYSVPSPQVAHNNRSAINMPMSKLPANYNHSPAPGSQPRTNTGNEVRQEHKQQVSRPQSQQQFPQQAPQQPAQDQASVTSANGLHPAYAALTNVNPSSYSIPNYSPYPIPLNPQQVQNLKSVFVSNSGTAQHPPLNIQQVQNLKSVFASNPGTAQQLYSSGLFTQMAMPTNTSTPVENNADNSTMQHFNNTLNMNLKLPAVRQMQRSPNAATTNGAPPNSSRPNSIVNSAVANGGASPVPNAQMPHGQAPHMNGQTHTFPNGINGQSPHSLYPNQSYSHSPPSSKGQPTSPMMHPPHQQQH